MEAHEWLATYIGRERTGQRIMLGVANPPARHSFGEAGIALHCRRRTLQILESERVRKLIFIGIVVAGAIVGLLSAIHDDLATRGVMAMVGALFGAAIGGAVTRLGRPRTPEDRPRDPIPALGMTSDDLVANYWRDKGRPQLTSGLEPEHGRNQFDPDKL